MRSTEHGNRAHGATSGHASRNDTHLHVTFLADVADASSSVVAGRHEHRRTQHFFAGQLYGIGKTGVITVPQLCGVGPRSAEHTSELQSLMRTSYAVFCLKKKNTINSFTPKHN